jgi:hypothetical protein
MLTSSPAVPASGGAGDSSLSPTARRILAIVAVRCCAMTVNAITADRADAMRQPVA